MPPKRTSARTGGQRSQATLSFHNQGPNRVTKPGAAHRHVVSKKDPALLDLTPAIAEPDVNEPTTAEAAIAEQTASVLAQSDPLESSAREADEEDIRASKISDAQVKKYWQAKERERKAPRVHQEGLSMQEKVLREWDMSGQYGVSVVLCVFFSSSFCFGVGWFLLIHSASHVSGLPGLSAGREPTCSGSILRLRCWLSLSKKPTRATPTCREHMWMN